MNFLFGRSDDTHDTRARVCWSTVIMPTSQGGSGIIDFEMQSRALLTKLIVSGLFSGNEPWKMLLHSGLATVTPTYGVRDGHIWTPGIRFLFTDAPVRRDGVSLFMRSLLQIWNSMRKGLIRGSSRCKEEIERQPLFWNSYVYSIMDSHTGVRQQQLEERIHIDWAVWDARPAASYEAWCRVGLLPVDTLAERYRIGRDISRRNMGLETIDIYYIHNPEIELGVVSRSAVLSRLRNLFVALEQAVRDGKISMYGVSSWNAFRVTSGAKNYLSLEELVNFAKAAAGGEDHHFKVVMVPFNLHLQDVATNATQGIRGKRVPLLHAAAHFGINVITSSPLFQGTLAKNIAPDVKQRFPELGDSRTDAQCALQFSRTTPGILATLTGMSKLSHMEENGAIVRRPALSRS
ncbi:hypothetical protein L7F22_011755 [Adiantum nelumboides]|nr:hypothetical protein [Adiantum nelumboides]